MEFSKPEICNKARNEARGMKGVGIVSTIIVIVNHVQNLTFR